MMDRRQGLRPEPETDPNAEKKAVALKYKPDENTAPKVVAKGRGHVAENILAASDR